MDNVDPMLNNTGIYRKAIVNTDGIVVNIILATDAFEIPEEDGVLINDPNGNAQIGGKFENGAFVRLPVPQYVPSILTAFQFKAALIGAEKYEQAEGAVKSDPLMLLAFLTLSEVPRQSRLVRYLISENVLDADAADEIFRAGVHITP